MSAHFTVHATGGKVHRVDPSVFEQSTPRPKRGAKIRREPNQFQRWAWSGYSAFRITLTAYYVTLINFGAAALWAGIPAFTLTAPEGWTPLWAGAAILGGVFATVGSIRSGSLTHPKAGRIFSHVELLGTWLVTGTLIIYDGALYFLAYVVGTPGRVAIAAGFTVILVPALGRLLWLIAQLGKK